MHGLPRSAFLKPSLPVEWSTGLELCPPTRDPKLPAHILAWENTRTHIQDAFKVSQSQSTSTLGQHTKPRAHFSSPPPCPGPSPLEISKVTPSAWRQAPSSQYTQTSTIPPGSLQACFPGPHQPAAKASGGSCPGVLAQMVVVAQTYQHKWPFQVSWFYNFHLFQ